MYGPVLEYRYQVGGPYCRTDCLLFVVGVDCVRVSRLRQSMDTRLLQSIAIFGVVWRLAHYVSTWAAARGVRAVAVLGAQLGEHEVPVVGLHLAGPSLGGGGEDDGEDTEEEQHREQVDNTNYTTAATSSSAINSVF